MLGQSALTRGSTSSSNRVFVYEVEGLRQNEQTDNNRYQIRNSSTILIQVPYSRMNEEMRRITRLGGKIVGIRSASETSTETPSKT
jgi:phycocyanin-associated, rod